MATRIAINGLGRIGRCVVRAIAELDRDDIELVAINSPARTDSQVHLLKYDSVHGTFPHAKKIDEDTITIGRGDIKITKERDPAKLPWKELDIDIVMECTGVFKEKEDLEKHLQAGAKKVLVSSPAPGVEAMIVFGVNNHEAVAEKNIFSVGSCTTNCLAPVAAVLDNAFGIEQGFMTTVHAYTGDQNLVDSRHSDLRRARAAALSMIPTSTGAAKSIGQVLPNLEGKLDGVAVRVPTPNVSLVDLTITTENDISVELINDTMKKASQDELKGVLGYSDEPLVSIDFTHNPHSSIFDSTGTKVMGERFCRIASWYDNEWGFSVRMLDVAALVAKTL